MSGLSKPILHVIAIQEEFLELITKQLYEIFGDYVILRFTTIKNLKMNLIKPNVIVLLSNHIILELVKPYIPPGNKWLIAKRGINFVNTKLLLKLPKGQTILVVNDNSHNTQETVNSLKETVRGHTYLPYQPDLPLSQKIDYIVTPAEKALIPGDMPKVIDIGFRVLDISSIHELLVHFELENERMLFYRRYIKACVYLSNDMIDQHDSITEMEEEKDNLGYSFDQLIAKSDSMSETISFAKTISKGSHCIHIFGEPGTGKSMIAKAIFLESDYNNGPFLQVNCATKTAELMEEELFGKEDHQGVKIGLIERAAHGTLCIERIEELPFHLQEKLLLALQEKQFFRTNGKNPIPYQTRIITISSTYLRELVDQEGFHADLFQVLSTFSIKVPSLIERSEDFELLIGDIKKRLGKWEMIISAEVMMVLKNHQWKGNVRELYNVISYFSCLNKTEIKKESMPLYLKEDREEAIFHRERGKSNTESFVEKIEEHGFLDESIAILRIFREGKKKYISFGRTSLKRQLEKVSTYLSEQQLRRRLEVLQELNLINVRQGRTGTTISRKGEEFLDQLSHSYSSFLSREE